MSDEAPDPPPPPRGIETTPREPGKTRQPVMAGMFYPADASACRQRVDQYLSHGHESMTVPPVADGELGAGGRRWLGAIVPHAGWICSGAIAGRSIAAIRRAWGDVSPDVVVVFGAIHSPWPASVAMLASYDAWRTPLGDVRVSRELQEELLSQGTSLFEIDDRFHEREHAVEVELPLLQGAWPDAAILPVEVPPMRQAPQVGDAVAMAAQRLGLSAVFLASSDLTHYGPAYGFAPAGVGLDGLAWAKQNDRLVLDRVSALAAEEIVPLVMEHQNACGPGAIAAMLSACRQLGASAGSLLAHASSYETLRDVHPQPPTDAVGYASLVVG